MKTLLPAAALLLVVGPLTACSNTSARAIRNDVTPRLDSTARSEAMDSNQYARVVDHNTRTAWDDLARFLFIDETTGMTPINIP